jgi:hypothetical protein
LKSHDIPLHPPEAVKKYGGFGEWEAVPSPGDGKRVFWLPDLNFFTASLFQRGKKRKEFSIDFPKNSPPFGKGRTGGISGKTFSKR